MRKLDLIGKTFGSLTVLEEDGITPVGHVKWKCQCSCGKIVTRTGTSLIRSKYSSCRGDKNQYSSCNSRPTGKESPHWKGVGDISKKWFYNVIVRAASGRKSRTGIIKKINIDINYIWDLFIKQEKKCALTGLELTFPLKSTKEEYKKSTASLDRIDSSKGYVKDNVQWVHKDINIMKNIYDENYFKEMCRLVTECTYSTCKIQ